MKVSGYVVELAKELVSIPTVTGEESRVAGLIETELKEAGMEVRRQEVEGAGFNILASRGRGGLLFLTHLDVFPPYDHPEPFEPKVEGEEIIGRGAADAKGQIAALISALKESEGPAEVALVVDEERLGRGSEALEIPKE
ncbi:MAG TPA: M20/M25/M40 family metallo-hydrolase, partial [Armatimonadetes bacterium]|nr:M20/M25/M40 family metallo-hydrolase [Armatimonadota bacterium]